MVEPAPISSGSASAPAGAIRLDPFALAEQWGQRPRRSPIEAMAGRSILGHRDISRSEVIDLCRLAALIEGIEVATHHPLDGKIVITAFFEASTRTRLSFESATLRLDGKVLSVPDAKTTGVAKGESLADIGQMFNAYCDLVIMRHSQTDALSNIVTYLERPIINAGNGSGEHPTQALVDWYALLKWRPDLVQDDVPQEDRIHLGIVGTPGNMRAVKSFMFLALRFAPALKRITVVSEMADPLGPDLGAAVEESGVTCEVTNDLQTVLSDLDVVYMNSIALLGDTYKKLDSRYKVTADSPLKTHAVLMHPLARREELDPSLDHTRHNLYFAQAYGAVYVRQALLTAILGRLDRLPFLAP